MKNKKLMIRGDQFLLALRCFSFLENCIELGDAELGEVLGFGSVQDAQLFSEGPLSQKENPHGFSLEKCKNVLKKKGLFSRRQRKTVEEVFGEYVWIFGVLQDFMEVNAATLSSMPLDVTGNTSLMASPSTANAWVRRFFRLFASGEITEEMLKESEPAKT